MKLPRFFYWRRGHARHNQAFDALLHPKLGYRGVGGVIVQCPACKDAYLAGRSNHMRELWIEQHHVPTPNRYEIRVAHEPKPCAWFRWRFDYGVVG